MSKIEFDTAIECNNNTNDHIFECELLRVRGLQKSDFEKVRSLVLETFSDYNDSDLDFWLDLISRKPSVVLERGNDIIGLANMNLDDENDWYINLLGIKPDYQGRKYGSLLLSLIEKNAKSNKAKKIAIHTEKNKPENVSFYSKNGYIIDTIDKNYYGWNRDGVKMQKIVSSSRMRYVPAGAPSHRHSKSKMVRKAKCNDIMNLFPKKMVCNDTDDMIEYIDIIKDKIETSTKPDDLICLERMANKISASCKNPDIKPTIMALKTELKDSLLERKIAKFPSLLKRNKKSVF